MTAEERIAAAQEARKSQKVAEHQAKLEQQADDLEAIAALEAQHGHERVIAIQLGCWRPCANAPTMVGVVLPTGGTKLAQRFIEQINRSKDGSLDRIRAQDALALECLAYPPKGSEAHKAVLDLAPLILSHIALEVVKAVQGVAEAEGKG